MLPIVLQIYLPCYFGNEMTTASEKLSTSLYDSNWVHGSKRFRTTLLVFFENTKRPLKLSAFGVFELTLDTFLRIINSAYSLFAVLKNVEL